MIDYQKIANSVVFYESQGYQRVEAPWWVSKEIVDITKPKDITAYNIKDNNKVLVGSGEQSFLYMFIKGRLPTGKCLTVTPCFRNESIGVYSNIEYDGGYENVNF